ncbi:hypothetical protein SmJEL517_g00861 [Synchytrium microbalum]|uniref:Rho-GAP domain-containing protein n=1 Tax=Synchytrium microbalum TaxID=1806994 RepID=A0A507CHA7_9FUNG|nr:uncharacterized protein SmJEL517_g00861 [Synchytrium microbalum]TPX37055.1 hypothetical protein SmJEL517_g00861 [Synchytrium microbalum]
MSSRMSSGPPSAPSIASSTPYYASTFRRSKQAPAHHPNPFQLGSSTSDLALADSAASDIHHQSHHQATTMSHRGALSSMSGDSAEPEFHVPVAAEGAASIVNDQDENDQGYENYEHGDEHQALGEYDNAFSLLLDRVKENANACKEVSTFIKRRAAIEAEYAKSMTRLAQSMSDSMEKNGAKLGSFRDTWKKICSVHERVGEVKQRFSESLAEIAGDVNAVHIEAVTSRKNLKVGGGNHWKMVVEAESALEKAKSKYEGACTEWETSINQLAGGAQSQLGPPGMKKSASHPFTMFKGSPSPSKLAKNEDDLRMRVAGLNDSFKRQLENVQGKRAHYFSKLLPTLIGVVATANSEVDMKLQKNMVKYAQMYEQALMEEGVTIAPMPKDDEEPQPSLLKIMESVDHEGDLHAFMKTFVPNPTKEKKAEQRFGAYFPTSFEASARPVFGVDVTELITRDGVQIPTIVEKCIQVIERHGMRTAGLYRQSGPIPELTSLRVLIDRDLSKVDLEKFAADITVVTGILKLWFRSLPDPILTSEKYHDFMEAAKIDDGKVRLMNIHGIVNELNDANFATLQCLMAHLHRVRTREIDTKMSVQSLAIVWGSVLMGPREPTNVIDLALQCRVIETILGGYLEIFPED